MEEKQNIHQTPFSFRNTTFPISQSDKLQPKQKFSETAKTNITLPKMSGEEFVSSLNNEMDMIMNKISNKEFINLELGKGSPNFNQNFNEENFIPIQNNTVSTAINDREEPKEQFIDNNSFGGINENFDSNNSQNLPIELKNLTKNFKTTIDKENFADVLNKNHNLKIKIKEMETHIQNLVDELSECQNALESILKIQIKTSISEEVRNLAEEKKKLQKDLEYFEDESYKMTEDFEKLQNHNINLEKKLEEYNTKYNISEIEEYKKESNHYKQVQEKLQREYDKLLKTHTLMQIDQEKSVSKQTKLEEQLNNYKSINAELESKLNETEKSNFDLSMQNSFQKQRIDNLTKELESFNNFIKGKENIIEEKDNIIFQLKKETDNLTKKYEDKYDELYNVLIEEKNKKIKEEEELKLKKIIDELLLEIKSFFNSEKKAFEIYQIFQKRILNDQFNNEIQQLKLLIDLILKELKTQIEKNNDYESFLEKYTENARILESRTCELISLKSSERNLIEEINLINQDLKTEKIEKLNLVKHIENLEIKINNYKSELKQISINNEELNKTIQQLQEINSKNEQIGQENQEIYLSEIQNLEIYKEKYRELEERKILYEWIINKIAKIFDNNSLLENFTILIDKKKEIFNLENEFSIFQNKLFQSELIMKESISNKTLNSEQIIKTRSELERKKERIFTLKQKINTKNNEINSIQNLIEKIIELERNKISELQKNNIEFKNTHNNEYNETKKHFEKKKESSLPKEEFFKREINKKIGEFLKSNFNNFCNNSEIEQNEFTNTLKSTNLNLNERDKSDDKIHFLKKNTLVKFEKPERLSLKEKLERSKKIISSPLKN